MMASTLSFSTSSPARPLSVNLSRKLLCLRAGAATFASAYTYGDIRIDPDGPKQCQSLDDGGECLSAGLAG